MKYRIEIVKKKNKTWFWRLTSVNGNILATSQIYKRKPAAVARNLCRSLIGCYVPVVVEQ